MNASQRILSLFLPHLSTDRLARQWRKTGAPCQWQGLPVAVYATQGNSEQLAALDPIAMRRGLSTGIALAEARAMHPDLVTVPSDEAADARLLDALADMCQRYTPLVAVDPPHGILLDISGCAHLFGGEEALATDLTARLTRHGFVSRLAVAGTIGAAWAGARFAPALLDTDQEYDFLAPLPLAALRLKGATVAAMARVGLKRIGDILDLPRAPLAARFGVDLLRQLDRARGDEREPLNPLLPVAPYVADQPFHEPIAREEDVLRVVERLAARLETAMTARGHGARRIELMLFRTDGEVKRVAAGSSRPIRDPAAIRKLFVERLTALGDDLDPGFGFDLARLSVLNAERAPDEQIGLTGGEDNAALDLLVDRLSARLGPRRVTRLISHDSHLPECAAGTMPAQAMTAVALAPGWAAFRAFQTRAEPVPRPLRLLARPEPIEAMAGVPDGPPVRFRWRRAQHRVVAAEGPERIEGAWWSEHDGPARDYFRVEDTEGHRFWVFRAGLYRDPDPNFEDDPVCEPDLQREMPRWFLHGMYG